LCHRKLLSKTGSATSYLGALGQSLAIAFLGTAAAAVIAVPLGFLAARNVVSGRVVHFMTRRGLHCVR